MSAVNGHDDSSESDVLDEQEMADAISIDGGDQPPLSSDEEEDGAGGTADSEEEMPGQLCYTSVRAHRGSVFCCCVTADGALAVTGGEDDCCCVWRLRPPGSGPDRGEEGPLLRLACDARDSIVQVALSGDESRLAVGELSGTVRVYDLRALTAPSCPHSGEPPVAPLLCRMDTGSDLHWLQWHRHSAGVLLAGTSAGGVWLWLVPAAGEPKCRLLPDHAVECTACAQVPPRGSLLVLGYGDGSVHFVELQAARTVARFSQQHDSGGVTCCDVRRDGQLAVCGSESGTITLYSVSAAGGRQLATLTCVDPPAAHSSAPAGHTGQCSVEQAVFCAHDEALVLSLNTDGLLLVWHVASQRVRHRLQVSSGASRLCWPPAGPAGVCYVGCLDGSVAEVDVRRGAVLRQLRVRSPCHLLDMCAAGDSSLLTALDDGRLCVFDLKASDGGEGAER